MNVVAVHVSSRHKLVDDEARIMSAVTLVVFNIVAPCGPRALPPHPFTFPPSTLYIFSIFCSPPDLSSLI